MEQLPCLSPWTETPEERGVRSSCLRPEVISQLSGTGSWIQLNLELPYAPTPTGMESSLLERQMILDPPLLTCIESFPFISSPSCIIPAINYSLENALCNIFFSFWLVCYLLERDLVQIWKPDLINFPFPPQHSVTLLQMCTYIYLFIGFELGQYMSREKTEKHGQKKRMKRKLQGFLTQALVPFEENSFWHFFTVFGLCFVVVCNNHFEVNTP